MSKPLDDEPNIDPWKIEKFDPAWNPTGMLEVSSFSRLFPQNREKYLEESWPRIESALKEYGVTCKLDLVNSCMTVSTTRETRDPYIIVKARDLTRLLARRVPAPQAIKILEDEMHHDIINIRNLVGEERFFKTRQRLVGPNSSTLKELAILTNCYILVQGSTVAAMGAFKGIKQLRMIVEDSVENNINPRTLIKFFKVVNELEKDPALANESWIKFLPVFKKKKKTNLEKYKMPCIPQKTNLEKYKIPRMYSSESFDSVAWRSFHEKVEKERKRRRQKALKKWKRMRVADELIAVASC